MRRREAARRGADLTAMVALVFVLSAVNAGGGVGGNAGAFLVFGLNLTPAASQAVLFLTGMVAAVYLFLRVGMGWGRTLDPDEWVQYQLLLRGQKP